MDAERRHHTVLELQQNIESLGTYELEAFVFSSGVAIEKLRPHFLYCAALASYASEATVESRPDDSQWFKGIEAELLARAQVAEDV